MVVVAVVAWWYNNKKYTDGFHKQPTTKKVGFTDPTTDSKSCFKITDPDGLINNIKALEDYISNTTGEFHAIRNTVAGKAFSRRVAYLITEIDRRIRCDDRFCKLLVNPNTNGMIVWEGASAILYLLLMIIWL